MKTVITYGTFDMFHNGHYNILKRAREYGDYLIVGVTGENYDVGRGKLSVHDTLAQRIENVRNTGLADKIIVEEYLGQKISDILRYNVDTFVIGDDWRGKFDHLSRYCNLVYLERTQGVSSTQIREKTFKQYRVGILTDIVDDNQIVHEVSQIDQLQMGSIYSENRETAEEFREIYGIEKISQSADQLIQDSDIVYIRCAVEKRTDLIRKVIQQGRHVICDPPCSLSGNEQEELFLLADENNVILIENVKMIHIHVFNQLLWMTQGGIIGDILAFHCSISRNDRSRKNIFYDLLVLTLYPMLKIMGKDYDSMNIHVTEDENGIQFASLDFQYKNGRASINVGNKVRVRNQMEIIGDKGTIRVSGNWWRGNYFELETPDADELEIYNTNYHGNGFRYLLRAMLIMLDHDRTTNMGITPDETIRVAEIIEYVRNKEETEA